MTINVTCPLDEEIYNFPMTVKLRVPSYATSAYAVIDGEMQMLQVTKGSGINTVTVKDIPVNGEDVKIYPMIAPIHEGLDQILYAIADTLATAPESVMEEEEDSVLYTFEEMDTPPFEIHNRGNGLWIVTGEKVEKLVQMASLYTDDGFKRFARQMRNLGVDEALRISGAQDGDTIRIMDFEFDFYN
jgi:Obg family GTPase CgtA-like protein